MSHDPVISGFSRGEYERRWSEVLARLADLELDALCVTAPLRLRYLTGSDGSGMWPDPFILAPGTPPTFVVRRYEEDRVRAESVAPQVVSYFGEDDAVEVWADTLRRLGLAEARVGLELDCWGLAPRDVSELQRRLPRLAIRDASGLVAGVMDVKSAEELAVMRQAMAWTRVGMEAFATALADGATENEVTDRTLGAMQAAGSEPMPFPATILVGRHTAVPHGGRGVARPGPGDIGFAEFGGVCQGYCAGLVRTAVIGRNPEAAALYDVARAALEAGLGVMRPGATTGDVDAACRGVVERAGRHECFRHRSGYAIGLDWQDRGNTSLKPGGQDVLAPGMTFHLPINLFERGRFGVGCSETVLVTDDGVEVLSGLSRELLRVGAPGDVSVADGG